MSPFGSLAIRTNCMRYLPNFFRKHQMEKIFICFPDPHFKAKNHRRRIVSHILLSEYAYLLKPGGRLYTVTGLCSCCVFACTTSFFDVTVLYCYISPHLLLFVTIM